MSCKSHVRTLAAIAVIALLVSLTAVQGALASEGGGHTTTTAAPSAATSPDMTVVMKATGDKIGGASVYVDDVLAGKTDSKGNLTLAEAPAAGNHTLTVVMKGLQNATVTTDFHDRPVTVGMAPAKGGKTITFHVTDRSTKGPVAHKAIHSGQYVIGETDANGDLVISDFPQGFYLYKLSVDGYRPTWVFMFIYNNRTQNMALSPMETTPATGH